MDWQRGVIWSSLLQPTGTTHINLLRLFVSWSVCVWGGNWLFYSCGD
jgi:hypothetical protein